MTVAEARAIITKVFADDSIACEACGWVVTEDEHEISDEQIHNALAGDGVLRLGCIFDVGSKGALDIRVQLTTEGKP